MIIFASEDEDGDFGPVEEIEGSLFHPIPFLVDLWPIVEGDESPGLDPLTYMPDGLEGSLTPLKSLKDPDGRP